MVTTLINGWLWLCRFSDASTTVFNNNNTSGRQYDGAITVRYYYTKNIITELHLVGYVY